MWFQWNHFTQSPLWFHWTIKTCQDIEKRILAPVFRISKWVCLQLQSSSPSLSSSFLRPQYRAFIRTRNHSTESVTCLVHNFQRTHFCRCSAHFLLPSTLFQSSFHLFSAFVLVLFTPLLSFQLFSPTLLMQLLFFRKVFISICSKKWFFWSLSLSHPAPGCAPF